MAARILPDNSAIFTVVWYKPVDEATIFLGTGDFFAD